MNKVLSVAKTILAWVFRGILSAYGDRMRICFGEHSFYTNGSSFRTP